MSKISELIELMYSMNMPVIILPQMSEDEEESELFKAIKARNSEDKTQIVPYVA